MDEYRLLVDSVAARKRLDLFLEENIEEITRSRAQKLIKAGGVLVNGKVVTQPKHPVAADDEVVCSAVPVRSLAEPQPDSSISLDILYEDDNFLVINKPAGIVVHPDRNYPDKTILNGLLAYDPALAEVTRGGIVHRLDKDVSGLLVVGKNNRAASFLKKQFATRAVHKEYIALVHGIMSKPSGEIKLAISRSKTDPRKMAAHPASSSQPDDREALTFYHVLKNYERYTLVQVRIATGRTHQIRVHLTAIGHPIVGDMVYKPARLKTRAGLGRLFLHASVLRFCDPSGEELKFESPLPEKLADFLHTLATRAS